MSKVKTQDETSEKADAPQTADEPKDAPRKDDGPARATRLLAPAGREAPERAAASRSLQRSVGNTRLGRMWGAAAQAQPKVGAPGDPLEREADRMADQVTRASEVNEAESPPSAAKRGAVPKAGRGGGRPLSKSQRDFMEPRFGRSFENVRLHTDGHAQRQASELGAKAFTSGADISFASGHSPDDKKLLAHELTHVAQQDAAGPGDAPPIRRKEGDAPSNLKKLDEMLEQSDVPEEDVILMLGKLNAAEKKTVLSGGYKGAIAAALDIQEMVRAVFRLDPPLAVKLEWVNAAASSTSDIDYSDIAGLVRKATGAERSALKSGMWRTFFVEVCNNKTMITALNDLGFDLSTKLEWADEEIDLSYSDVKGFVTSALQVERDALKTGPWRSFFVKVCDDETMAEAVSDLRFDLTTKLDWMLAEGTNFGLVAPVIRLTPAGELPAAAADTSLMKRLREELGETDFQTAQEMLTQGLLSKGPIEQSTDTGNLYKSWLRHTRGEVTISKDVKFIKEGTFSAGGFDALKQRLIAAVTSYLSGKYKVKIESSGKPPQVGDGEYPIVVVVKDNPSAAYPMRLHGGAHGRSGVTEDGGNIYELGLASEASIPDIALAHESAHMVLGASDEYANPEVPARTLYTDHSLMGNFYNEGIASAEIKARHFKFLVGYISKYFPDRKISIIK